MNEVWNLFKAIANKQTLKSSIQEKGRGEKPDRCEREEC